jgi:polyvinyl alcohol dehydrogenase (cytochrome)
MRNGKRLAAVAVGALGCAALGACTYDGDGGEAGPAPVVATMPGGVPVLDPAIKALGEEIYSGNCAACHENTATHSPSRAAIATLTPESVLHILTSGRMQQQAAALDLAEKEAVAQALTNRPLGLAPPQVAMPRCTGSAAKFDVDEPPLLDGWGFDANNSHSIPADVAGLTADNVGQLTFKWAFAFPQALDARSQPAIAGGAIYVGGTDGKLYALDRESGCLRWSYTASAGIRNGVVVAPWQAGDASAKPLLYFGDAFGNTYALDAKTGAEAWVVRTDDHQSTGMTGSATLYGDTLYVPVASVEEGTAAGPGYECCTFRGSLLALDATTGAEHWRTYFVDEPKPQGPNSVGVMQHGPSGVAVWSAPVVDPKRGSVYVATGDNYSQPATELSDAIVALDMKTGAIRWAHQVTEGDSWNAACFGVTAGPNCPEDEGPDFDFGAAPIMMEVDGKDYLLAGQKSGIAYAFNPDDGTKLWHTRVGRGGIFGGAHFGIAAEGKTLYVPIFDQGETIGTDLPAMPGLYAIDIATGERGWSVSAEDVCNGVPLCSPGYSAAITATSQLVFAGGVDAHMRVFDAKNGKVLWDEDTNRSYPTVNGVTGHGGSMSGSSAPIAVEGTLIFNSGYSFLGKMPGNVLLVYGVD